MLENKDQNYGYDARLDRYCDMVKEGIIDPTKVVRSALQNAASVATLLLTSDALVADAPKEEKKPGGGGEDMYRFRWNQLGREHPASRKERLAGRFV